jgi:flagellar hook-associated protein 1 FlgK
LSTFIGQVLTVQGQAATNADSLKQGQDVVVNGLQTRMNGVSGVNIDQEMTSLLNLQNTYAANARVFSVVQQMLQTLMQM